MGPSHGTGGIKREPGEQSGGLTAHLGRLAAGNRIRVTGTRFTICRQVGITGGIRNRIGSVVMTTVGSSSGWDMGPDGSCQVEILGDHYPDWIGRHDNRRELWAIRNRIGSVVMTTDGSSGGPVTETSAWRLPEWSDWRLNGKHPPSGRTSNYRKKPVQSECRYKDLPADMSASIQAGNEYQHSGAVITKSFLLLSWLINQPGPQVTPGSNQSCPGMTAEQPADNLTLTESSRVWTEARTYWVTGTAEGRLS
ncbi:hypothetical protein Bbelb_336810 [Branchiostoma belcheri]|nr:hypothetical protein Bbelb_336810 [Branchiostoma belcheri]